MAGLVANGFEPHPHPANLTSSSSAYGLFQPAMHAFSSILLLGACAVQAVFGRPEEVRARREAAILKRSVDTFIETQTPISWQKLLCNIGSSGCAAQGAADGVVVASPSKSNPDCRLRASDDS
jgi:hypothetical protein